MGARHPEGVRQEDIIAAATAANAHGFITQLKDGYATEIGERGIRLSRRRATTDCYCLVCSFGIRTSPFR